MLSRILTRARLYTQDARPLDCGRHWQPSQVGVRELGRRGGEGLRSGKMREARIESERGQRVLVS